jgi:hypothetical protein
MNTRANTLACMLVACACAADCGVGVEGDFDGIAFQPTTTVFGLARRHAMIPRQGAVVPVLQGEDARTASVLFSSGALPSGEVWRLSPSRVFDARRRELVTHDGLLLDGLSMTRLQNGDALEATASGGDFPFALVQALPSEEQTQSGLGSLVSVVVRATRVDDEPSGGGIDVDVELRRERDVGQPTADVVTGQVRLRGFVAYAPERVATDNLAAAWPVMSCAMAAGPTQAAACANEDPLLVLDETGP